MTSKLEASYRCRTGIKEGGVTKDREVFIIKGGVSDLQDIKIHPMSIIIKPLMVYFYVVYCLTAATLLTVLLDF